MTGVTKDKPVVAVSPATEFRVVPIVVISPVRDETRTLELTINSMLAQSCRPQEWVIVDDGSSDDTPEIIQRYAAEYDFIHLEHNENRGFRQLGSGVIRAFDYGRTKIRNPDWQYIVKLDGDLSFGPRYLEIMLAEFEKQPRLAATSGKVFRPEGDKLVEEYHIDDMVVGQFKLYRREAFEEIGGFPQTILWDGIDMHRCRMKGWITRSFHHPEAQVYHHRLMGSSDKSVYHGRVRLGKGIWFMGYHPLYAIASGLFRMHEKPYVIGGLIIIASYFWALLKREPRFDDLEFRQELQRWQLERLRGLPGQALRKLTGAT